MENYYKNKHLVVEVKDQKTLNGYSNFSDKAFGASSDTGTTVHDHAIEFATSIVVNFKDSFQLSWKSNVNPPKLCKLCRSTGEEHILPLCNDRETMKLMEIHDSLITFYDNKPKWELLDKNSVFFEGIKLPAGDPRLDIITKIERFIAVLRWAQIVLCVKPELGTYGDANPRDACPLYEKAVSYLRKVSSRIQNDMEVSGLLEPMKIGATFLAKLLVRLLAGMAALRLCQPVSEDQRNMNATVMLESNYWREYGSS